jgi:hypothetical protein
MGTPTMRQFKFLNFFKIQYAPNVSQGQAGMLIAQINSTPV